MSRRLESDLDSEGDHNLLCILHCGNIAGARISRYFDFPMTSLANASLANATFVPILVDLYDPEHDLSIRKKCEEIIH